MGRTKKKAVSKKRMSKKQKVKKGGSNINEQTQKARQAARTLLIALDETAQIALNHKKTKKCFKKNGPAAPAAPAAPAIYEDDIYDITWDS